MSDTSRVKAWIEKHGRTNMTEWDRQPAIDGGNKVTRLARCIGDLKAQGMNIPTPAPKIKIGDSWVADYRLVRTLNPCAANSSSPPQAAPPESRRSAGIPVPSLEAKRSSPLPAAPVGQLSFDLAVAA